MRVLILATLALLAVSAAAHHGGYHPENEKHLTSGKLHREGNIQLKDEDERLEEFNLRRKEDDERDDDGPDYPETKDDDGDSGEHEYRHHDHHSEKNDKHGDYNFRADYPEIENYQQDSETETSITVSWTINIDTYTPLKYRMTINDLISNEFFCQTASCTYTVSNLSPCNEYKLTLVAVFAIKEETSQAQDLTGHTAYSVPGSVSNVADDGNKVSWDAPSNANCVSYYEVCYTSDYFLTTECVRVNALEFTYNVDTVSGCDTLSISIAAATGDDQKGPQSVVQVVTDYGVPSEPRNFKVSFISSTEIFLEWDIPASNAACITDFSIVYGPVGDTSSSLVIPFHAQARQDFTATLTNLNLCTNYQIQVAAVSTQDELGPPAVDYAQTEDSSPGEIPNIEIVPDSDGVMIQWGDGSSDPCLGFVRICYSDPIEGKVVCELIEGGGPYGNYSVTGLSPCRGYTFIVQGVSPGGQNGTYSSSNSETVDVQPGPVRNLQVSTVSETSMGVGWDEPSNYPECVQEYEITYVNLEELAESTKTVNTDSRATDYEDILSGLHPCVDYEVDVVAVSASGLRSPERSVNGSTAETPPGAPRNGQVVSTTVNSVTVLFYAPIERFCVHKYIATFVEDGSLKETTVDYIPDVPTAEQFVHTFASNDLKACTGYTFQLESYNPDHPNHDSMDMPVTTACN